MNTIKTAVIVLALTAGMIVAVGCSDLNLPPNQTKVFAEEVERWDDANAELLVITRDAAYKYQHTAPMMVDYDHNGTLDLVVGYKSGYIEVVLNGRTDGFEVADNYLMSDPAGPIYFCDEATPYLHDTDLDGKWEMLVGCFDGSVLYVDFNVATPGNMDLWIFVALSDGGPIVVPNGFAAPAIGDVSGDGLGDLLVGAGDGAIYYHENLGVPGYPDLTFIAPEYDFGERAALTTMDLDGNGILDAVIGNEIGEVWACPSPGADCIYLFNTYTLVKPTVGDYNHDGMPDLVYGTEDGGIWMILAQP